MSYQPLAIKYRPQNFDELIGQQVVSTALKNSIRLHRPPNALILSGVRGIGKTTIARIYAKALNCDNGPSESPCGTCDSCRAITNGVHEDVIEIDGASNTSVDDIRNLKETIVYVPQRSRYKIYIIDEVHMLSTSAFNALLKTLEEPPQNVIFIFATTEIQKIPQTIISRCQTFFLEKITHQDIFKRLVELLNKEGITFEEKALEIISKEAKGSMRDALTLLDKTIVLSGANITVEALSKISASGSFLCIKLLDSLINKDQAGIFNIIKKFDSSGVEFISVVEQLIKIVRHCFVVRDLGPGFLDLKLLAMDSKEMESLVGIAKKSAPMELNTLFRLLIKCRLDLAGTDLDKYIVENYMFEWCILSKMDTTILVDSEKKNSNSIETDLYHIDPKEDKVSDNLFSIDSSNTDNSSSISINSNNESINKDIKSSSHSSILNLSTSLDKNVDLNTSDETSTSPTLNEDVPDSSSNSSEFPSSWDQLVERWKKQKPFQARILEEVVPLEYSKDKITLLIKENSLAGSQLLHIEKKNQIFSSFKELFGFTGTFNITTSVESSNILDSKKVNLDNIEPLRDNTEEDNDKVLNEKGLSILEKKEIQKKQFKAYIDNQTLNNCIVKQINNVFKDNKIIEINTDN